MAGIAMVVMASAGLVSFARLVLVLVLALVLVWWWAALFVGVVRRLWSRSSFVCPLLVAREMPASVGVLWRECCPLRPAVFAGLAGSAAGGGAFAFIVCSRCSGGPAYSVVVAVCAVALGCRPGRLLLAVLVWRPLRHHLVLCLVVPVLSWLSVFQLALPGRTL